MGKQIHKRLPKEFIADIVDRFEQRKISEKQATELLGIKRAQLYNLQKKWLRSKGELERFNLYKRTEYPTTNLPEKVNKFLHKELTYIKEEAKHFKGKYNFELLSAQTDQEFGIKPHRNTIRRWAINHGYYDGDVKKWIRDNEEQIMNLIVLSDPTGSEDICSFNTVEFRYALPDFANNKLRPVEFLKLLRFIRLWRKLDWSIEQI